MQKDKFDKIFNTIKQNQEIREFSFFINKSCNLNCPFCYASKVKDTSIDLVDNKYWIDFISQAQKDNLHLVSIVGMEPFVTKKKTLNLLKEIDAKFPKLQKGMVSNLHLLDEDSIKVLKKLKNLYIDVSLDGSETIHDSLRGKNAFKKSVQVAQKLKKNGIKVIVSHMICKQNINDFEHFISECKKYDLDYFSVFAYVGNDKNFQITKDQYINLVDRILHKKTLDKNLDVKIIFKNDYLSPEIMFATIDKFINIDNLQIDENKVIFEEKKQDKNTFYFNYLPFPLEFTTALRANYNGDVLFCKEYLGKKIKPIGNISEEYKKIKNKLHTSSLVKKFYKDFFTKHEKQIKKLRTK